MTWVKKMSPDWQPQEHKGIIVGDVVDFPGNVQRLVEEGSVVLCDEKGNELSAYDTLGVMTDRELQEFKDWRAVQQQEALKKSLENEREELLAQAEELKKKPEETEVKSEEKSDFATRMAAARAAKKAEREATK